MSEDKRHPVYASTYTDKNQAINAARALFAEVYHLLLAQGLEVTVRPFDIEKGELPQIHCLNGVELHDGSDYPIISFALKVSYPPFSLSQPPRHFIEVRFEPGWHVKKVSGFDNLVNVTRNYKRTPNAMDPKSICEFVVKYVDAICKRREANDARHATHLLEQARLNKTEELVKELLARPEKGRAHVFACRDKPKYGEHELWLQLRGTPEEIRRAVALLDPEFPLPQTKTSQE